MSSGGSGGGSTLTVQDEGTELSTAATTLNFTGSGVTASGTGATKTITISGGDSGTSVTANPTLSGSEANLTSLTVGATSYKIQGPSINTTNLDLISNNQRPSSSHFYLDGNSTFQARPINHLAWMFFMTIIEILAAV